MRSAGAGLIVAALLALAGCKSTDTTGPEKNPAGIGAGRPKGGDAAKDAKGAVAKGPSWLDDVNRLPGGGTALPKATSPTNPKDPNFDAKAVSQEMLGGRVLDPYNRPARNVEVRIEEVGVPAGSGAPIYISANNEGYFEANGLKAGRSYELSVSVTAQDGKTYSGSVQTKVPNVTLALSLRDDLPPRAGGFPPVPRSSDALPPGGPAPVTQPKPLGEAWSPSGPTTGAPPATLGGTPPATSGLPPTGAIPEPDPLIPSPRPLKPENVADGPKEFKPPVTAIPNGPPPVPPLPKLPPTFTPSGSGTKPLGATPGHAVGKFTLLDTLERPWESDSVRPGSLVLVEFATTSCVYCPRAIPVLKDLQSRYGANGLQVKGVLCDDLAQKERAETASRYGRDHNLNYAMYVEPVKAGSTHNQFEVKAYPHAVLLDSTGRILWSGNPLDRTNLEAAVKQGLGK